MAAPIFTDKDGRPFGRPDLLPKNASTEEKICWLREMAQHKDAVAGAANRAFAKRFRSRVKGVKVK